MVIFVTVTAAMYTGDLFYSDCYKMAYDLFILLAGLQLEVLTKIPSHKKKVMYE
jgi:hypothetical protein